MREEDSFHMFFEKFRASAQKIEVNDPKLHRKRNVSSRYEDGKARAEFISTVEEHYRQFLYQTIDMVTKFICNRFQQKNCIETFKIIENLLLKALREEDLSLELLSFFAMTWISLNKKSN